mmetsp:Transcript_12371/g.29064  ORF Transcript_12371/g.29064 Transcript_12371/m.29064 type:complete len:106 (+) Transcript_12371:1898-2215(+)
MTIASTFGSRSSRDRREMTFTALCALVNFWAAFTTLPAPPAPNLSSTVNPPGPFSSAETELHMYFGLHTMLFDVSSHSDCVEDFLIYSNIKLQRNRYYNFQLSMS